MSKGYFERKRRRHITAFLIAAVVLLVLITMLVKKKNNRVDPGDILGGLDSAAGPESGREKPNDDSATQLQGIGGSDNGTVLIFPNGNDGNAGAPSLVLTDVNDSSVSFTAVCSRDILIGRKAECTISLAGDKGISRRHCIVRNDNGTLKVSDCQSANGTFVNDIPVKEERILSEGDILKLGDRGFRVHIF